jgi:hypothetical protein
MGKVVDEVGGLVLEVARLRPPGPIERPGAEAVVEAEPESDANRGRKLFCR